jgi:hypothetical protein
MSRVTMKSSLASRRENWVLEMCICYFRISIVYLDRFDRHCREYTFFMVLFMAPVTPELHDEPKLMHEMRKTAINLAISGGGSFPSSLPTACSS